MKFLQTRLAQLLVGTATAVAVLLPTTAQAATVPEATAIASSAATDHVTPGEVIESLERMSSLNEELQEADADDRSTMSEVARDDLADNVVTLQGIDTDALQWDQTRVFVNGERHMVQVPAAQISEDPSALTIFYDSGNEIVDTVEILFTPVSESALRVRSWQNQDLQVDKVVDGESKTVVDTAAWDGDIPSGPAPLIDWGVLNDCLASQGISWAIITGLSVVCGFACVGTAGWGCAVCLSLAGAGTATTVYRCVKQAW